MTLFQIFETVNFISGKYPTGQTLTPDRLNTVFPYIQDKVFSEEMDLLLKASLGNVELLNRLLSTSILKPFKKQESVSVNSAGVGVLPVDYVRYLSGVASYGGGYRTVDFVSEEDFRRKQGNVFTRADLNPFAKVQGNLYAVPFDIASVIIDYLRKPLVPYFDCVQPSANPTQVIYLNPGNSVECSNAILGYFDVYKDQYSNSNGDDPLYSQVYYSLPAVAGVAYRSRTIELEWESYCHIKFVTRLLKMVGVNLDEKEVAAMADKMESEGK